MKTKNYIVQKYSNVWDVVAVVATPKQAMSTATNIKKAGQRSRVVDRRTQKVVVEIN